MSMMKIYVENLAEKYLEEHPNATWEQAMKAICEGEEENDEKTK